MSFVEEQQEKAVKEHWYKIIKPRLSETEDCSDNIKQIVSDTIIATCEDIIEYDIGVVNPNRVYDLRVAMTKLNEHMEVLIKQAKENKQMVNEYKITNIEDIIKTIPSDRLDIFFKEFRTFIETAKGIYEIALLSGEENAISFDSMIWADDGEEHQSINIVAKESDNSE